MYKNLYLDIVWSENEVLKVDTVLDVDNLECEEVTFSFKSDEHIMNSVSDTYSDLYGLVMRNRTSYNMFREELLKHRLFMNFRRVFFVDSLASKLIAEGCWDDKELTGVAEIKKLYNKLSEECDPERFEKYHIYLSYESLGKSKCFHVHNCGFLKSKKRHNYYLVKNEAKSLGLKECHYCIPHKKKSPSPIQEESKKSKRNRLFRLTVEFNEYVPKHLKAEYIRQADNVNLKIRNKTFDNISVDEAISILETNLCFFQKKGEQAEFEISSEISVDDVIQLCDRYGIKYHFAEGLLFLKTMFSSWAVQYMNNKIRIFHENYDHGMNENYSGLDGYHIQDDSESQNMNNILEAIRYIYSHDKQKIQLF